MPRDVRSIGELLSAIHNNRLRDVKNIFETKIRKRDKGAFQCLGESDEKSSKDRDYESAIIAAAKLEDTSILKYFIQHNADVNFITEPPNGKGTSPLHVAVNQGLYENINLLLDANADVNKTDHCKRSPLHIAVKMADIEATRILLNRGANVTLTDKDGYTALQIASKYGHIELVRVLLEHHAEVFQKGQKGPSPLHIAAIEGHLTLLELFGRSVDVNIKVDSVRYGKQKSALHLAAGRGLLDSVTLLADRLGADLGALDGDQRTALHCVVGKKYDRISMRRKEDYDMVADFLLRHNINVDALDKKGNTPLHLAARNHFHRIAELLLDMGADTTIKNNEKKIAEGVIPDYDLQMKQLFKRYGNRTPKSRMPGDDATLTRSPCHCSSPLAGRHTTVIHVTTESQTVNDVCAGAMPSATCLPFPGTPLLYPDLPLTPTAPDLSPGSHMQ